MELAEFLKSEEVSKSSSGFSSFILILIKHKTMLKHFLEKRNTKFIWLTTVKSLLLEKACS